MASAQGAPSDHLVWKRAEVGGRVALYGEAGRPDGIPLVFVHGWALGQHAYKRALKRLVHLGCHVWAPALPGFGGSADLPTSRSNLAGYAGWLAEFMDAVGIERPAFVVGHSFGGGVAIKLAHDEPDRIRTLVLVNSVGGATWRSVGRSVQTLAQRPIWDWGLHFPAELLDPRNLRKVLPVVLEDLVPNLLRNPFAILKAANVARTADLTTELEELRRRGLPIVALWGDKDRIIPRASFDALCTALGREGEVVSGAHSWLLADPDAFGDVMTNIVPVAELARGLEAEERSGRRSAAPQERAAG